MTRAGRLISNFALGFNRYNLSRADLGSPFPPFFPLPSATSILTSSSSTLTSSRKVSFSQNPCVGSVVSDGRICLDQCCSHSRGRSLVPSSSEKYRTSILSQNLRDMSHSLRSIYLRPSISKQLLLKLSMGSYLTVSVGKTRSWRGRLLCPHLHGRMSLLFRWKT